MLSKKRIQHILKMLGVDGKPAERKFVCKYVLLFSNNLPPFFKQESNGLESRELEGLAYIDKMSIACELPASMLITYQPRSPDVRYYNIPGTGARGTLCPDKTALVVRVELTTSSENDLDICLEFKDRCIPYLIENHPNMLGYWEEVCKTKFPYGYNNVIYVDPALEFNIVNKIRRNVDMKNGCMFCNLEDDQVKLMAPRGIAAKDGKGNVDFIMRNNGVDGPSIGVEISNLDDNTNLEEGYYTITINYCPVCRRQLRDIEIPVACPDIDHEAWLSYCEEDCVKFPNCNAAKKARAEWA